MAFCGKCGKQFEDGTAFCPSCGAQANAPAQQQAPVQQANTQNSISTEKVEEAVKNFLNTTDTTSEFDNADIESNKIMAILAYLFGGLLFFLPLVAASNSKFGKYHANQAFTLLLVSIVFAIVGIIFGLIPIIKFIVPPVLGICVLVLMVIGMINAATGKAKELPIIGKYTFLK